MLLIEDLCPKLRVGGEYEGESLSDMLGDLRKPRTDVHCPKCESALDPLQETAECPACGHGAPPAPHVPAHFGIEKPAQRVEPWHCSFRSLHSATLTLAVLQFRQLVEDYPIFCDEVIDLIRTLRVEIRRIYTVLVRQPEVLAHLFYRVNLDLLALVSVRYLCSERLSS